MRHICLYIGVQIFIARAGAGPPEVVQEALADLKIFEQPPVAKLNQLVVDLLHVDLSPEDLLVAVHTK